jgi:putative SOS response-associated peptidase YedK
MCGRFVGYRSFHELKKAFPIDQSACEVTENYNFAPSQEILAIIKHDNENWLEKLHWGLVPFWAKDISIGDRMINARAETVATKPGFRNAFKKRRCLILADGFYEWLRHEVACVVVWRSHPARPAVPSAVPYEVWRRGNESSKSPRTMYLAVGNDGCLNREGKTYLPASRRTEARVGGKVSKCESP